MARMETLQAAAEELRRRFGQSPQAGVVLGSGLGGLADGCRRRRPSAMRSCRA